jgi:hypothetical protein
MEQHKNLANGSAFCRWNLGLSIVQIGQVHANHLVCNQVQLVVDQLDLELHIVELQENFLASFMVVQQNPTHQSFQMPVNIHSFQVLRGPPSEGASIRNPRVGGLPHLVIRDEPPQDMNICLDQVHLCLNFRRGDKTVGVSRVFGRVHQAKARPGSGSARGATTASAGGASSSHIKGTGKPEREKQEQGGGGNTHRRVEQRKRGRKRGTTETNNQREVAMKPERDTTNIATQSQEP